MFNLFKKNPEKEKEKNEKGIEKVVDRINVKCAYGAKFGELNESEKIVYLNHIFQKEIEAGGFSMLFFHASGDCALEMLESLQAIGAVKTVQLLQEGIAKFPKDYATLTHSDRQDILEEIDANDECFVELNEALQAMGENISVYQKAYMLKHQDALGK